MTRPGPGSSAPRGHHTTLILFVPHCFNRKGAVWADVPKLWRQPGPLTRAALAPVSHTYSARGHGESMNPCRKISQKPSQQNQGP